VLIIKAEWEELLRERWAAVAIINKRYNHRPDTIDSSLPANAGGHRTTRHQRAFMKQNSV
jgi:hypothetical protein